MKKVKVKVTADFLLFKNNKCNGSYLNRRIIHRQDPFTNDKPLLFDVRRRYLAIAYGTNL